MNADSTAAMMPNAMTVRAAEPPTALRASMRNANRRATPCFSIASAMTNAPMNRKIAGSPKAPITSSADPTLSTTHSTIPIRPVIGIGIASLIQ
jgi:hypothetical protein